MTSQCATSPSQLLSIVIISLFPAFQAHGIGDASGSGKSLGWEQGLDVAPGSKTSRLCDSVPSRLLIPQMRAVLPHSVTFWI